MGHSRQASKTTFPHVSLFTKGDDSAKTVPVWCFSDGHVFGLFVPLPRGVLLGFTQESNISLEAAWPNVVSQFCVRRVSITVPEHLDSSTKFHNADVTSRALYSHFVSWF